jgi:uncharacterized RDD family membrane protein YckC
VSGVPQPLERPPTGELGERILYMLLFALVFWIVCWILALTAIAQLLVRLLSGRANPQWARFGSGLARYTKEIIEYLTFATDRVPYPVGEDPA